MTITVVPASLTIESTASILDLPAFHAVLRDWEDEVGGIIYPVTHTWKALDLGGGAFFYQADLVNGWQLKFPNAGSYQIDGNLNGTIVPVAGVYVERKTSAAYVTTAIGGSGPSAADIASSVWGHASAVDVLGKLALVQKILRNKTITDPATGQMTVYDDDDTTPLLVANLFENAGGSQPYRGQGAEFRGKLQ